MPTTPATPDYAGAVLVPARKFTPGRAGGRPRLVVLHSTETGPCSALGIARGWASPRSPDASSHYIAQCCPKTGAVTVVQCVREADVAWAAPSANLVGIQVEHVGRAVAWNGRHPTTGAYLAPPQPRTIWDEPGGFWHGLETLRVSAALVADICRRHAIPVVALTWRDLIQNPSSATGLVTHAQVSLATQHARAHDMRVAPWYREDRARANLNPWVASDHGDPGGLDDARWPWQLYLELVRGAAGARDPTNLTGPRRSLSP